MNSLPFLLSSTGVERLGWALIHFIWQGTAVALLYGFASACLHRGSAKARYFAGCFALALMAAAPLITFCTIESRELLRPGNLALADETGPRPGPALASHGQSAPVSAPRIQPYLPSEKASALQITQNFEHVLPWLVEFWFAGVCILALRMLAGWLRVRRLRTHGVEPLSSPFACRIFRFKQQLRISRTVLVLKSVLAEVPMVIGWLRPAILVPAGTLIGLTPAQVELVLAHELAPIRRHDHLVNVSLNSIRRGRRKSVSVASGLGFI